MKQRGVFNHRHPGTTTDGGFTLIELLAVLGIMLVLGFGVMTALSSAQGSYQLVSSAALLKDNLDLARRLAMASNLPVTASFCATGTPTTYNTLLLSKVNTDGSVSQAAPLIVLPQGFSISQNPSWSSLMTLSSTTVVLPSGKSVSCQQIEFYPSGQTSLDTTMGWFFTVYRSAVSAQPAANYILLEIDPLTGRITPYQP